MNDYEKKLLVEKHTNYRLTFLNEKDLKAELENWSREDIIEWLKWNDPNGIYRDQESLDELGNVMSYHEGVEILINQIFQYDS